MNALGARGDAGKDDFRSGHREVGPVMLTDADEIDACLIGKDPLIDEIADDLRGRKRLVVGTGGDVAKCIDAEFELLGHKVAFHKSQFAP